VIRTDGIFAGGFALLAALAGLVLVAPACSNSGSDAGPTCGNGRLDGDETTVDCGGSCRSACGPAVSESGVQPGDSGSAPEDSGPPPRSDDALQNGTETDVDCGGANAPKCALGKKCLVDGDCDVACSYAKKCIDVPSCKPHLGGDTCGKGEVGEAGAVHESCCRTLPVTGFADPGHPGKAVYLDKYEITAGRVRAFLDDITAKSGGKPNIRDWVVKNTPTIWDPAWNKFLPTDREADTVRVAGNLLGDVRPDVHDAPPPTTDQDLNVGVDFQFNAQLFVYLHGNNCSTHAPDAYGFPTFFYPPEVLAKQGPQTFPPRSGGTTGSGAFIPASEHLEVKSINCITNALLAAFCHWDGGQLATDAVLDFVTGSPPSLGNRPGCGTQIGWENPPSTDAATKGGRCADLALVNAAYDAGGTLPLPGSPLNDSRYEYPFFPVGTIYDKAWEISAPGRGSLAAGGDQVDVVRLKAGDEPWMDLAGNLNEAVLTMNGATFSGKFGLKYRGIGYQSARSPLNMTADWPGEGGLRRIERPEARAGFAGGRCMRFK
jgi:hypothetical protein